VKRITIWITATLAVVALLVAFQLNATGSGGKTGENDQRPATVSPSGGATPDDGGKSEGDTNDQTGKPGENK